MDLDLTPEQEMLRRDGARRVQLVRARSRRCASWRTTRSASRPSSGSRWRSSTSSGLMVPGRVRRLRDEPARRRGRLHGARPRARAVAALRERGDERGRAAARPAPRSRSRSGCRGSWPATRSSPPRGSSPATASARRGVQTHSDGRRRRVRARRREVARAVRVGGDRDRRARADRRRRRRRRPVPRRSEPHRA